MTLEPAPPHAAEAPRPAEGIPTLAHAGLFFVLAAILLVAGQFLAILAALALHLFGPGSIHTYAELAAGDARLGVPTQAIAYTLILLVGEALFRRLWSQPAVVGIHWRSAVAARRAPLLVLLGLFCGLLNGVAGNFLPMPKDPPILADMMRTPVGAWLMLVVGVTLAPLMEEIAFRGFLLPGFVHAFASLERRGVLDRTMRFGITMPMSILLTSLPFALRHGAQVSHAWAPLLLIGIVSVVLCLVRLLLGSVAASTLVHASYNLTLFLGILWQTGGFRHLDRLTS